MKTGLFLAALVQLAAAQPHRAQRHARLHQKRVDDVVVTTQYVTATAPDAVVFVNGDGTPVSTSYASGYTGQPVSSVVTAPAAVAAAPTEHAQHHHHHHHHHHKDNTPAPAAAAPAPAPAAPAKHHNEHSSSASSSDSQGGLHSTASNQNANLGITYTAYNSDGSCKTQDEVNSDFARFDTYQFVRIYGVDCEQLVTVPTAAAAKGMKVMIGAFDYPPTQDVQTMISTFKGDWSTVETVNVANEIVNQGIDSAAGLVENINAARTALRAAGYGGPVVASDVFSTILENPTICQNSDFAAANAHAFFDSDCVASNAGSWVKNVYNQLQQKCQKRVVITESGWPNQGQANGAAVPGFTEQTEAISGIVNQFKDIGNMFVFTAFDDMWKTNFDGSFGTEQFWGIMSGQ